MAPIDEIGHLIEIVNKYGIGAVPEAFTHWMKDFMSPDGVPFLPYTKEIAAKLDLGTIQTIEWLNINFGDFLAGGISAYHSYELARTVIKAVETGVLPTSTFSAALIGAAIKIGTSVVYPNPLGLAAGLVDMGFLIFALSEGVQISSASTAVSGSSFAKAAFWSGSAASCASFLGSAINKRQFNFKKEFLSGAVGGICGYGFSVAVSANPIGISASAIGGFILARDIYQYMEELEANREEDSEVGAFYWVASP